MIAVAVKDEERAIAREFFELFKTPWHFAEPGDEEDVLLCTTGQLPPSSARLVLFYGSQACGELDDDLGAPVQGVPTRYHDELLPLYGTCMSFPRSAESLLRMGDSRSLFRKEARAGQVILRIGYDLFAEVRHLLEQGQPAEFAGSPTLDLHIAILRELLIEHGVSVVEIPPVPAGYDFTVCLTHDVDHPRIKCHRWDHTAFGFLARAFGRSIVDALTGRKSLAQLVRNWKAAVSLPAIYSGQARDLWDEVAHYLELERDFVSTFFFIPMKGRPGLDASGREQTKRAAAYELADVREDLERLHSAGNEIAVHGIDAWRDAELGRQEQAALQAYLGTDEIGVRMHWLFFGSNSPAVLEAAGYSYDSSLGYNESVGYRNGTTQVFQPAKAQRLLELPLHLMDTALFYPSYLHLREAEAGEVIATFIKNSQRFGGVLTVNWHDRSLAPERLWEQPYRELLEQLRAQKVWSATAGEAVAWFRKRRAASFASGEGLGLRALGTEADALPPLQIRVHHPRSAGGGPAFTDRPLLPGEEFLVAA